MTRNREKLILLGVIGLTLISVTAGFKFYLALFNLTTAILLCMIFEMLRLACLWSVTVTGWLSKIIAVPVYVLVTLTCAFAAVISFHSEIIESHTEAMRSIEIEITRRIQLVKREYAKKIQVKVGQMDEKIDLCKRKLAWYPNSHYWQNRLEQLTAERDSVLTGSEVFLQSSPAENKRQWLDLHVAELGMELEPLPVSMHGAAATTAAIQELYSLDEYEAKKIVSIIIVITTECGIVLLSLLARGVRSTKNPRPERLLTALKAKFGETELRGFLQKCTTSMKNSGRLPLSRELGKKERAVRKFFVENKIGRSDIDQLLAKNRDGIA